MRSDKITALWMTGLLLLTACGRAPSAAEAAAIADSALRATPGYVVDSILPPEEALRRFRGALAPVTMLDGKRSRHELVTSFVAAVRSGDVETLQRLTITRAEYAFLAYPELPVSRPPFRQPPEIAWLLLSAANASATARVARTARTRFEILDYACPDRHGTVAGALRLHAGCTVRVREAGAVKRLRLFGTIVERAGRWKFLSLEGDL